MKKHILIGLTLVMVGLAASAIDRLYIDNFNIQPGETLQIPVVLVNDTIYSGFQTDLYLPEGLTLDMEDDEFIIDLTNRATNNHSAIGYFQADGAIRIYVSSINVRDFSGNDGAIMTLSITATQSLAAPVSVFLRNTICAESIGTKHELNDEECRVNDYGSGILPGDVNGDGNVNISDVTALIDLLLSGGEISAGTDVNGDGQVNISDVTALINRLLSGN